MSHHIYINPHRNCGADPEDPKAIPRIIHEDSWEVFLDLRERGETYVVAASWALASTYYL